MPGRDESPYWLGQPKIILDWATHANISDERVDGSGWVLFTLEFYLSLHLIVFPLNLSHIRCGVVVVRLWCVCVVFVVRLWCVCGVFVVCVCGVVVVNFVVCLWLVLLFVILAVQLSYHHHHVAIGVF